MPDLTWLTGILTEDQRNWLVILVVIVIAATQFVKVNIRILAKRRPTDREIYLTAAVSALGFTWTFWPTPGIAAKLAAALVVWLLADLLAKYGLRLLKWKWPDLHEALNGKEGI